MVNTDGNIVVVSATFDTEGIASDCFVKNEGETFSAADFSGVASQSIPKGLKVRNTFESLEPGMSYIAACGLASGRFTPSVTFTTPVKKTATIYHENQDIYLEDMHGRRLRRKRRKLFIKDSVNIIQKLSTESFALLTSLQWGPQVQYMDGGIMGTTYKYNIVQTNFLASDLLDFGITNGNAIKGMKLKIASGRSPSQNYENFRGI